MVSSLSEQFAALVRRIGESTHAHLCEGDPWAAMVWDDKSEVTIRLSLRDDEIWLFAGSGVLVRFIADSDGEFDRPGITSAIDQILAGTAIEYFGVADAGHDDIFATGFDIGPGEYASGLDGRQARFRTRLAGPMAVAGIDVYDND